METGTKNRCVIEATHVLRRKIRLESVDSYLYSRLRDGDGCAARTMEPECLMPSKQHTKFNIITKEWYTNIPK